MAKAQKIDIPRLCMAMQRSRYVLLRYRQERLEAVREYVGHHWSEESTVREQPVNLLSVYINVMTSVLIAHDPRVMLSTFNQQQKPMVSAMESWANKEIVGTRLAETLQRVVMDALFSVGICKVALATPADSAEVGWNLPAGSPFAERVDLDDFVFDVHARAFGEESFIGHRFRVPLEVAKKLYGKSEYISPQYDELYNAEGDERISVLGRTTYSGYDEEFEDHVTLWEVYLPRHRLVMTLGDNQMLGADYGDFMNSDKFTGRMSKALLTKRWLGPDSGPYHILGFGLVPGNAMPKGPVQDLIGLHMAVNSIYRKLIRESDRFKMVGCSQSEEDAQRIQNASDGEVVRANPESVAEKPFGGPNQLLQAFVIHLKDIFSWLCGNLDAIAGLAPQSKTLGQDEMLQQSSHQGVQDKQNRTVKFTESVVRSLCWYWYHDPLRVMRTTFEVPGMPEMAIPRIVTPIQRQVGKFENLDIMVDPYSLQHTTPAQRVQFLQQMMGQIIAPMMPILQQQGIQADMHKFLAMLATYSNQPDLKDILTIADPPESPTNNGQGDDGQHPAAPGAPAMTTRNYTRRSVGQDTMANRQHSLMNQLSAAGAAQQNGAANTGAGK